MYCFFSAYTHRYTHSIDLVVFIECLWFYALQTPFALCRITVSVNESKLQQLHFVTREKRAYFMSEYTFNI